MIDTHCHLTDPRINEQLEDVLARAKAANVECIVTIGTHPNDDMAAIEVCRGRENLRCAIGVHPNYCHEVDEPTAIPMLRQLQNDSSVVALGEMGLDYHYDFADRARQRRFFENQLQLASELDRPAVIHCREAVDDCLKIMSGFKSVRAVFHCFTGTVDEGERIVAAGYFLGFTGVVTFKNSEGLRETARRVPSDRFLVETDAPFLSPEPIRKQKVNEPALVMHTAKAVSQIRGISLEKVDQLTTKNAQEFFNWP
jgi:TatD DNase family protein